MPEVEVVYLSSLQGIPDDWDAACGWIQQWCFDHQASFYSKPAESFFISEAKELAVSEGNTIVLIDSLS